MVCDVRRVLCLGTLKPGCRIKRRRRFALLVALAMLSLVTSASCSWSKLTVRNVLSLWSGSSLAAGSAATVTSWAYMHRSTMLRVIGADERVSGMERWCWKGTAATQPRARVPLQYGRAVAQMRCLACCLVVQQAPQAQTRKAEDI